MMCAITTVDNIYDPFEDFINWFMYDVANGYNTCNYLARIAVTSESLSDSENEKEIERAIDEIVSLQPKIYKKVTKENEELVPT